MSSSGLSLNDLVAGVSVDKNNLKKLLKKELKKEVTVAEKPLPLHVKKRIERKVAYESSSKDISRWLPLVSSNRKADRLDFQAAPSNRLTNASIVEKFKPSNDLEKMIQELLDKAAGAQKDSSGNLPVSTISPEQMQERQVELQKMRSLVFFQDLKRKRQAKIKSKSYRKVHRKQRVATDSLVDKVKKELERAKERISLRHKSSQKFTHNKTATAADKDQLKTDMTRIRELKERMKADSSDSEFEKDTPLTAIDPASSEKPLKGVMAMKFMQRHDEPSEKSDTEDEGILSSEVEEEASSDNHSEASESESEASESVLNNAMILDLSQRIVPSHKISLRSDAPRNDFEDDEAPARIEFNMKKLQENTNSLINSFTLKKELLQQVFAQDNIFEEEFLKEKQSVIEEDAPKVKDETLPGWGAWGGAGTEHLPKRQKLVYPRRGEGLAPEKRKDAKLRHVIVNEKKIRNLDKYQLERVPFPFKDKLQYELSQRMPIGKEWNTEQHYRKQIEPRVVTTPGQIIEPLKSKHKKKGNM